MANIYADTLGQAHVDLYAKNSVLGVCDQVWLNIYTCRCLPFNDLLLSNCPYLQMRILARCNSLSSDVANKQMS